MGCLVRGTQDSGTGKLGSGAFERKEVRCNAQQKPESSWLPSGGVTLPFPMGTRSLHVSG